MRANSAAPGAVCGGLRGGLTTAGNTASITEIGLPAHVLDVLHAEGINTIEDWRRLSRKRRDSIFGLPPARVRDLDRLAREART